MRSVTYFRLRFHYYLSQFLKKHHLRSLLTGEFPFFSLNIIFSLSLIINIYHICIYRSFLNLLALLSSVSCFLERTWHKYYISMTGKFFPLHKKQLCLSSLLRNSMLSFRIQVFARAILHIFED